MNVGGIQYILCFCYFFTHFECAAFVIESSVSFKIRSMRNDTTDQVYVFEPKKVIDVCLDSQQQDRIEM